MFPVHPEAFWNRQIEGYFSWLENSWQELSGLAGVPLLVSGAVEPQMSVQTNHGRSQMNTRIVSIALAACLMAAGAVTTLAGDDGSEDASKAIAQLYELQAAFHDAAGGAGVDATTKAKHLSEMLELFTDDAVLIVGSTVYVGRGDVNTACAPGSLTLCDFFQNHAGSFVLGRNWAALTSLARTHFEVHGKRADVYFECHYFDVATAVKDVRRVIRTARPAQHGSGTKSTGQMAAVIRGGRLSDSLLRVLVG